MQHAEGSPLAQIRFTRRMSGAGQCLPEPKKSQVSSNPALSHALNVDVRSASMVTVIDLCQLGL